MKSNSFFYSVFCKTVGILLLLAAIFSTISYGGAWGIKTILFHNDVIQADYINTEDCKNMAENAAIRAVHEIVCEDEGGYDPYLNSDYVIKDMTGKVLDDDRQLDEKYDKTFQTYVLQESEYEFYTIDEPEHIKDRLDGRKLYDVTVYLNEGLPYNDIYRNHAEIYDYARTMADDAQFGMIFSAVAVVMLVIYEMCVAGHKRGRDGITLTFFDRIPYEILCLVTFIAEFGVIAMFAMTAGEGIPFKVLFLLMAADFSAAGGIFVLWLMSTAARVKAGKWWRNTIVWRLWNKIVMLGHTIPTVRKTFVLALLWVIFELMVSASSYDSLLALINFFLSVFLGVSIVYCAWSFRKLEEGTQKIIDGDLDYRFNETDRKVMKGRFLKMADNLEQVAAGMKKGLEKQIKSERLKAELITNVSHDIKTPLTSIINYVDLLQKDHTEEQEKEYIEVLDRQSQRLKKLTEDVVEASKASTGNITVNMNKTNVKEILEQAYAEYEDKIADAGLTVVMNVKDVPLYAHTDGRLLWRVLRNLLSNCAKYALSGTRVYIDAERWDAKHVKITVKNTSRDALNVSADELMERFVRGDASRHTEGSGLGLNIARSLTELLQGEFRIKIDGDLFKAEVILPVEE